MNVTRESVVDRQAVLHVEVDEDHLERHLERAYRRLVQRTNIPGFRRGKAPRRIFETMVGRDTLVEEALETLV
ncbi:MAG: trigger factor family protein, partial [Dehalococcoidia bacterium]